MVVNPLRGLKVAPFYGCHIIRPESVNGWESSRNPHSLEDLITALGGEPVDYAGEDALLRLPRAARKAGASPRTWSAKTSRMARKTTAPRPC